jgi:hypothetical protein
LTCYLVAPKLHPESNSPLDGSGVAECRVPGARFTYTERTKPLIGIELYRSSQWLQPRGIHAQTRRLSGLREGRRTGGLAESSVRRRIAGMGARSSGDGDAPTVFPHVNLRPATSAASSLLCVDWGKRPPVLLLPSTSPGNLGASNGGKRPDLTWRKKMGSIGVGA